jgi:hypothetical protein
MTEIKRDMATSVYFILMYEHPQTLADLDSLQRRRYGAGLSRITEQPVHPVRYDYQGEELEDVAREMEKAPSRSRGE